MDGWIGVGLDGTLAKYEGWRGPTHIGEPVPLMVDRVKLWLSEGRTVKVFTARVALLPGEDLTQISDAIFQWCQRHIGTTLEITNVKDYAMHELWDTRVVQVVPNTGKPVGSGIRGLP